MIRQVIVALALSLVAALTISQQVWAAGSEANLEAQGCGSLKNAYGPFNYNTAKGREHWPIVRDWHFTESVRTLRHGHTGHLWGDLDYTLRAFPNQPWALYDMAIYQLKHGYPLGGTHESVGYYSATCYFKRAMVFAPKDGVVRMIYGIYLQRKGDNQAALKLYKQAEKLMGPARSAELHYNMGLLYFAMKDYTKAREQAKQAYAKGYPLSGLHKQLKAVGQWSDSSSTSAPNSHGTQSQ